MLGVNEYIHQNLERLSIEDTSSLVQQYANGSCSSKKPHLINSETCTAVQLPLPNPGGIY